MDLPLKLAISQLVKRNLITEITPLFGSCKIGQMNEELIPNFISNFKIEMRILGKGRNILLVRDLIDYIRNNMKTKFCKINTIELANKFGCMPGELLYCIGLLTLGGIIEPADFLRMNHRLVVSNR
jgi:hypothetical protein